VRWRPTFACGALALALAACGGTAAGGAASSGSAASGSAAGATARVPDGDWTRFDYDAQRSGAGPSSTGISAGNVGRLRARVVHLNGTVDSAAIQLHAIKVRGHVRDVVIATTIYGQTIALDPATGTKLWEFTPHDLGAYKGTSNITQASPVADPDRRYIYAATPDGWIHKLSVTTGSQVWAAQVTSDPGQEKIGGSLNLSGRDVIAVVGGHNGDNPPYVGHVALIDRSSGRFRSVWNANCSNRHHLLTPPSSCPATYSAIWARAGVVVEPRSGRLLFATGNGPFNGSTNWGDSVIELPPDASHVLHHWTPTDEARLYANDGDLGSSSPALLPGGLAAQAGKVGVISLLDLTRLNPPNAQLGGELQNIGTPGSGQVLTQPAVWRSGSRTYMFVANDSGTWGYYLGTDRRLHVAWRDGNAGSSPVVAGGLLYVYDPGGTLNVLAPRSGRVLRGLSMGRGHWSSPIVVGGRVIVSTGNGNDNTTSGSLYIFHLPGR